VAIDESRSVIATIAEIDVASALPIIAGLNAQGRALI
jgi:hypothetical protein